MSRHLTSDEIRDIVNAYCIDMIPMIDLAKEYNRTREGIWKVIRKAGVNPKDYERINISCAYCGKEFTTTRSRLRNRQRLYCSLKCYYKDLNERQKGTYIPSRQGLRKGREAVSKVYPLKQGEIVHHIDRNTLNNDIKNLMVFRNHGDHLRWHRGNREEIVPLFDGRNYKWPTVK